MTGNWKAANAVEGKCGFTRSMMTFNIFALNTCDFNIDMFKIFQVSSENLREIFIKKSLSQMIEICLIWREKAKINFGGKRKFHRRFFTDPYYQNSEL